ncbi:MAG: tetrahydrofolate dehydrogenase/cyclohydrolase catalytic domain-containing protein [Dermatophilaceae bacterium]
MTQRPASEPARLDDRYVRGGPLLAQLTATYQQRYRSRIEALDRRVVIIRFTPDPDDPPSWRLRMAASAVSARSKIRATRAIGYGAEEVELPARTDPGAFAGHLDALSATPAVTAIIVQFPPPPQLLEPITTITPEKDVDALLGSRSTHRSCATADGAARIAAAFRAPDSTIAVVGARGFVGSGVTALLADTGSPPLALDAGDDLTRLHAADIIVTATGQPGLLRAEHLAHRPRLVIDTGYTPHPSGDPSAARGDVHPDAEHLPRHLTPVPGGIGPIEMAVLLERLIRQDVEPELTGWRYRLHPSPGLYVDPRPAHPPTRSTRHPGPIRALHDASTPASDASRSRAPVAQTRRGRRPGPIPDRGPER